MTFTATILLLIFGEITPKTIATRCPDPIAYGLSGFVSVFVKLMYPLVFIVTAFAQGVLRLFGIKPDDNADRDAGQAVDNGQLVRHAFDQVSGHTDETPA